MKLALLVYFASVIENFSFVLGVIGFLGLIVYFVILGAIHFSDFGVKTYSFETTDMIEKQAAIKVALTKKWKLVTFVFSSFLLFSLLAPSEKSVYLIAGAYATEKIASSDRVQKIGNDVLEVIENKLSELKGQDAE